VNNLLMALSGTGALLREELADHPDPALATSLVDDIDQCVERGGTLTRELMAFGRRQMLEPAVQLAQAVVERVGPLLQRAASDGATVTIDLCDEPLFVTVDRAQLELALLNLVLNVNGVAALRPGGRVVVRLRPEGADVVCFEVEDDGQGIDPSVLPHIYEPFFTTRSGGTGLGLPSVHGFVAQSGGQLECRTQLGSGTTFRVLLPRALPPAGAGTPEPPTRPSSARRALVCDDDPRVLQALVRMLKVAGYEAVPVNDALEAAAADPFAVDLLITDVSMPGLRGPELAQRLRQKRKDLPVLYVSGYTQDIDLSLEPGPLLQKPFALDALLEAVAEAVEPAS
jgi:CheY-like chemotaxis protein